MNATARPCVSGVFPHLCLKTGLGPPRSECGVGALMAWADRLWAVSYVSSGRKSGVGGGLYEIDEALNVTHRPESRTGTFTNRFVHFPSNQLVIGPHVIDADRNVRTAEGLLDTRLCGTCEHPKNPERKVYVLGMEGEFFEMDVRTLAVKQVADLVKELDIPGERYAHFKACYTLDERVFAVTNCYEEAEFLGKGRRGRLGEWDGETWTVIERNPFVEVTGRRHFTDAVFATGWDRASAILRVFSNETGEWTRYRLPKASHTHDHWWQTEWPRIRETEHERFLMDCHGMFYELSPWNYGRRVWGVRPISTHLWVLGDFCTYRGMLVLGADNASPSGGENPLAGEPQSGLWFGKTDDLWQFGKPSGWGGPWTEQPVKAGVPSDPYLMTGFDKKCLHLSHNGGGEARFAVEVDPLGWGAWQPYETIVVPSEGYAHHEFPDAFSAHWVRLVPQQDTTATATFLYT